VKTNLIVYKDGETWRERVLKGDLVVDKSGLPGFYMLSCGFHNIYIPEESLCSIYTVEEE
jgi:hypothetical protein